MEEEAEVTHILRLTLVAQGADGTIIDEMIFGKLSLEFGEGFSLRPRVKSGVHSYTFVAEGYYVPLSMMDSLACA